jgi:hypothetical protein
MQKRSFHTFLIIHLHVVNIETWVRVREALACWKLLTRKADHVIEFVSSQLHKSFHISEYILCSSISVSVIVVLSYCRWKSCIEKITTLQLRFHFGSIYHFSIQCVAVWNVSWKLRGSWVSMEHSYSFMETFSIAMRMPCLMKLHSARWGRWCQCFVRRQRKCELS